MTMHIAGWRSLADQAGAASALTALIDQAINTETSFLRVPTGLPQLVGEALYTGVLTAFTSAQVQSPSLRQLANQSLSWRRQVTEDSKGFSVQWHGHAPRELKPGEGVEFVTNTDAGVAVELHGLIWLADGPVQPAAGNMFTTRATAAIAAVNTGWTSGVLNFVDRLPIGIYDVVGMAAYAADGTAARLVFPGLPFRPGVPLDQSEEIAPYNGFRYGRAGVFGQFDLNQPPQLEVFGGASAAQVIYLDLIRRS